MIDFENIQVVDGVLTASAVNLETGNRESITAKLDGSFHSSTDWDIVKATWNVIGRYKGKKFPKETSVVWGQYEEYTDDLWCN